MLRLHQQLLIRTHVITHSQRVVVVVVVAVVVVTQKVQR